MRKNKGTTKCDKSIVICDVSTTQCEDNTIKCDVLVTRYSKLPTSGYCTKKGGGGVTIELTFSWTSNNTFWFRSLPYLNAL